MGHRFYWPEIGRFIQQDPIRDDTNWYAYAANNPLVSIDPEGLLTVPGLSGKPWLVFDEFVAEQAHMSAGATMTGLVDVGSLGIVPALRHFGVVDPRFADWTHPCDEWAGWSRNWGRVSGAALVAAGGVAAAEALGVEANAFSRGNVFKIISRTLKGGFRIDRAHHRQPWGHMKCWRW